MNEWTPYKFSVPKQGSKTTGKSPGAELTEVYHVAHVPHARRILDDNMIRAGLIGDESRLKSTRTSVAWFSANYWNPGSIYGTVQFTFNWKDLIEDNQVYWVEDMDYPNPAYRFLFSQRDLSKSKQLKSYDPETDDGPLKFSSGVWYWNAKYTSEFMLDRDVCLDECTELSFISHRSDNCRLNPGTCEEANQGKVQSSGGLISYVLGRGLTSANHALISSCPKLAQPRLNEATESGIATIYRALAPQNGTPAGPIKKLESSVAVVRGALLLYGSAKVPEAKQLAHLCHSKAKFESALTEIVRKHFGLPNYKLPA